MLLSTKRGTGKKKSRLNDHGGLLFSVGGLN